MRMEEFFFDTPFGRMGLASQDGDAISRLYFPNRLPSGADGRETPLFLEGRRQLLEYFAGERREFDLPLRPEGTSFERRIWHALAGIPYGQTRSYRDLACAAGCPRAARAAGGACRRNRIPILIPCHRVVGAAGALTGFGGGLELKKTLLLLEQRKECAS